MATLQQAAGLHPFVTEMKIVDPTLYPKLTIQNVSTIEWCQPVIVNDLNMYTVVTDTTQNNTVLKARLVKFQRQDFHENYFTAVSAMLPDNVEVTVQDTIYETDTFFNPILLYDPQPTRRILLMHVNQTSNNRMILSAYQINNGTTLIDGTTGGPHDLIKLWENTWTPLKTDINQYGFFLGEGGTHVYWYKIDGNLLTIRKLDRLTGEEGQDTTKVITLDQPYTYCKLTLSLFNNDTFYITVRNGDFFSMATCRFSTLTVSIFVQISKPLGTSIPSNPDIIPFTNPSDPPEDPPTSGMCSAIYGYNYDTNNILRIAYLPNIITDGQVSGLETPFYYNVNKFQLFSEVENVSQSDMSVAVTTNPNNPDFMYVVYVATTSQIRIVKLYRNTLNKTYETHAPIVMWGTRLGVIPDSLNLKVGVNVDTNGNVYVLTWTEEKYIKISKIREYIIELGHTEGSVVADIDTIPNLLTSITNEYTIMTPQMGLLFSAFPNANDVTIDTIENVNGEKITITLKYLNYTYIQAFPLVIDNLRVAITTAFQILYADSSIAVLNLDPNGVGLSGTTTTLQVDLPIGTLKKPCVIKGTEIIRLGKNDKPERVAVEHINVGDKVLNHVGEYVSVVDHLRSTIYAEEHNAPYLVPRNFFGVNRPYKDLLISGDHGILAHFQNSKNMKVVYAEDITVLKKTLLGITVDFHHLLLENHQDNFYLANGLEVDSYHPGCFMRKKL